jgi:hypothetical protein
MVWFLFDGHDERQNKDADVVGNRYPDGIGVRQEKPLIVRFEEGVISFTWVWLKKKLEVLVS